MDTFIGNLWRLLVQTYNVAASHGFAGCAVTFALGLVLVRYAARLTGTPARGRGTVGPGGVIDIHSIDPAVPGTAKGFGDRMIALFCNLVGSALLIISLLAGVNVAMYGSRAPTDLLDRAQRRESAPQLRVESQDSVESQDPVESQDSAATQNSEDSRQESASPSSSSTGITVPSNEEGTKEEGTIESSDAFFTRLSEFFDATATPAQIASPLARSLALALDRSAEQRSRHVFTLSDDGLTEAFVMTAPRESEAPPDALFCVSQGAKVTLYVSYTATADGVATRKLGTLTFKDGNGRKVRLTQWAATQRDCDAVYRGLKHYQGLNFVDHAVELKLTSTH